MSRFDEVMIPDAEYVRETDKACLFLIDEIEVWLPWSQITQCDLKKPEDYGEIYVHRWIAEDKDLEYEEI